MSLIYPLEVLSQTIPLGRRLWEIVADEYPLENVFIGGTTGSWAFGTPTGEIMDREFSYVTPENDFKQWNIHPDNSPTWNWVETDAWVSHIAANNQVLRIHGPIGPQCSAWAKDDSRTASELETNMRDFMRELCIRYNGVPGIEWLDVVNEALNSDGTWFGPKPGTDQWENPWTIIGFDTDLNQTPLYIKYAFEIANQYAPDMKLIINQHSSPSSAAWDKIKDTVQYLRNQGLRVDGIGWQAHIDSGWETDSSQMDKYRELVDWAHANNLEFHITEFSSWCSDDSAAEFEKQAATYRSILEVVLEKKSTGLVAWNTWHIDDAHGWQKERYPSLFDTQYEAKPAYYAVQAALEEAGISSADFVLPEGVDFADFAFFSNRWMDDTCIDPNYCDGTDLDSSGTVDMNDLLAFTEQWLE